MLCRSLTDMSQYKFGPQRPPPQWADQYIFVSQRAIYLCPPLIDMSQWTSCLTCLLANGNKQQLVSCSATEFLTRNETIVTSTQIHVVSLY